MSHRPIHRHSAEEMVAHRGKQRSSGLSIEAYCRREGICPSSWWYWRKKIGQSRPSTAVATPVSFLQLPQPTAQHPVELTLPNGSRICVSPTCDTALIARLVGLLSGLRAG